MNGISGVSKSPADSFWLSVTLNIFASLSLNSLCFQCKLPIILVFVFCQQYALFFWLLLKIFLLLSGFEKFDRDVFWHSFLVLTDCWVSWICGFVVFIRWNPQALFVHVSSCIVPVFLWGPVVGVLEAWSCLTIHCYCSPSHFGQFLWLFLTSLWFSCWVWSVISPPRAFSSQILSFLTVQVHYDFPWAYVSS